MARARFTKGQQDWIRNVWLPALRSGKYRRGKDWLNKDGKHCCLGVAADLVGASWFSNPGKAAGIQDEEGLEFWGLPDSIADKIGISRIGLFEPLYTFIVGDEATGYRERQIGSLSGINDHTDMTFEEIADFIEDLLDPETERSFVRIPKELE